MILRGIDFGRVWGQSGVQGFFGEGYPLHRFLRFIGLTFNGCTLVAKTGTVDEREGKMPLQPDGLTPKEWKPKCIVTKFFKGVVLNAVSLSNFGFKFLLDTGRWQAMRKPFMLSFMSLAPTAEGRLSEARKFAIMLKSRLHEFQAPVALQINESCPNHEKWETAEGEFLGEVSARLDIFSVLGIPLVVKLAIDTPVATARKIAEHPACDAIAISNTIAWGKLSDRIDWKGLFGTTVSPLKAVVGLDGGLSGWPLLPLVKEWLLEAREVRFPKPIAAGGGILKPKDVDVLINTGMVEAICVGSLSIIRPWRMQRTINRAHKLFRERFTIHRVSLDSIL